MHLVARRRTAAARTWAISPHQGGSGLAKSHPDSNRALRKCLNSLPRKRCPSGPGSLTPRYNMVHHIVPLLPFATACSL
jgi:hypothetical protein